MRSNKPILIATVFFAWICITYFLWSRQTSIDQLDNGYKDVYRQLDRLEADVQRELHTNRETLQRLLAVVQGLEKIRADQTGPSDNDAQVLPAQAPPPQGARTAAAAKITVAPRTQSLLSSTAAAAAAAAAVSGPNNDTTQLPSLKTVGTASRSRDFTGPIIPILVFACNRVSVSKCLHNLLEYRPNVHQFPIIVSLDCDDEAVQTTVASYADVNIIRQPDQTDIAVPPKDKKFKGYYKIARHYGWALNATFQRGYDYVVIVEDDLNVAPDFYEYFDGTHELLKQDTSLWCVSAWNDNGKAGIIDEEAADLLYRTDFFPGLGWMLTKELWSELSVKWPVAFWDDWIRQPQQRKGRACIRPEISRTRTFGKIGVSNGLFFEKHLRYIKLSEKFVPFTQRDLNGLQQNAYDDTFLTMVYECPVVTFDELRRGIVESKGAVRIQYNTKDQYKRMAKLLGLMDDFKSGVPRTGYHGIVSFMYKEHRVYLAPNVNWKGYDLTWS